MTKKLYLEHRTKTSLESVHYKMVEAICIINQSLKDIDKEIKRKHEKRISKSKR